MKLPLPRIFESSRRLSRPSRSGALESLLRIVSGIGVVVLVAGCMTTLYPAPIGAKPGGGGPTACTSSSCAGVATQFFGNRCQVSVSVDPIKVPGGTVVYWTLAQPASDPVVFLSNGIVINDPTGDFSNPTISTDGTVFSWTANARGSNTMLKYSVHAVWMKAGTDGILCKVLDPIIVNEG